jgi:GT2 family glycosyltransferase
MPSDEPGRTSKPESEHFRIVRPDEVVILVLNWNRKEATLACLASLERADLAGAKVMVVDNGSHDGSPAAIRERFPWVEVLPLPENRGFAGGNNAGIRVALERDAGAVVLLNNDTEVAADFLHPLLLSANGQARIAGVSSVAFRMDNRQVIDAAFLSIYFGHGIVWHHGVNKMPGEGFDQARPIDAGIGCSFLMRADALQEIGLLDEDYFAYHEEVDWCFRARAAGYHIIYQPLSVVWHHGSKSTDTPRPPKPYYPRFVDNKPKLENPIPLSWSPIRCYLGARNSVRFVRKHATRSQTLLFIRSTAYCVVLEFLAAVTGREEEYDIGAWTYPRFLAFYLLDRRGITAPPAGELFRALRRHPRWLLYLPFDLLLALPYDTWRAYRAGCLAQVIETVRGLWDGILDRPLPLRRLGLR